MGECELVQDVVLAHNAEASHAEDASRAEDASCADDAGSPSESELARERMRVDFLQRANLAYVAYQSMWLATAATLAEQGASKQDTARMAHKVAQNHANVDELVRDGALYNFRVKVSLEGPEVTDLLAIPPADRPSAKKRAYKHEFLEPGDGLADGLIADESWDRNGLREHKAHNRKNRNADALWRDEYDLLVLIRQLVSFARATSGVDAIGSKQVLRDQLAWLAEEAQPLCGIAVDEALIRKLVGIVKAEIASASKPLGRGRFEAPPMWPGMFAKKPYSQQTRQFTGEMVHALMPNVPLVERNEG